MIKVDGVAGRQAMIATAGPELGHVGSVERPGHRSCVLRLHVGLRPVNGRASRDGKAVGAAAAAISTTAAACAVCCVLPFALPATALASFGGVIAWLAGAHAWVTMVAVLAVIAAWLWVASRSYKSRARPAKATLVVLLLATTMLGLALLWPGLEPSVIALLFE